MTASWAWNQPGARKAIPASVFAKKVQRIESKRNELRGRVTIYQARLLNTFQTMIPIFAKYVKVPFEPSILPGGPIFCPISGLASLQGNIWILEEDLKREEEYYAGERKRTLLLEEAIAKLEANPEIQPYFVNEVVGQQLATRTDGCTSIDVKTDLIALWLSALEKVEKDHNA
ncbi:hypothetical protein BJ508DRAFT_333821 [Ascobolus immersus RN42]|uniref:Uncharacterized protein n=1 Tax=Ascobolus immersus RN42 TaxID=1160509 RepID=A0A3N4HK85_ASCIM|nr:hypothetical protein BJ508DRAFT_333821 [Ascobolus immersus RN42]